MFLLGIRRAYYMKKLLISLIIVAPLITGCAYVDTRVNLNDDNSASVVTSLTYKGDLNDKNDIDAYNIMENYKKFLDNDYQTETAFQKRLSTITAVKSVKNLRVKDLDLSSLGFKSNLPDNKFINIKKNFLITSYNIDCEYDAREQKNNLTIKTEQDLELAAISQTLVPEYYEKYGDPEELEPPIERDDDLAANLDDDTRQFVKKSMDEIEDAPKPRNLDEFQSTFSIKVPSFASYNNADNIEGNVYSWQIKNNSVTKIKLQYVRYSGAAIGIVLIFGVILLFLFARRIRRHDSQKRVDNNNNIV